MKKFLIALFALASVCAYAKIDAVPKLTITDVIATAQTDTTAIAISGKIEGIALNLTSVTTNAVAVTVSSVAGGSSVAQTLHSFSSTADVFTNIVVEPVVLNDKIRITATTTLDGTNTYGTADVDVTVIYDNLD